MPILDYFLALIHSLSPMQILMNKPAATQSGSQQTVVKTELKLNFLSICLQVLMEYGPSLLDQRNKCKINLFNAFKNCLQTVRIGRNGITA